MKKLLKYLPFLVINQVLFAQNQPPVIENLSSTVNWATNSLALTYSVADEENDPLEISLAYSTDNGKKFTDVSLFSPVGDIGFPVTTGTLKTITCDISSLSNVNGTFIFRLVADDRQIFDIQTLVDQVDSNRLSSDLRFVEGIRHRSAGLAHLLNVRDSLRHHFEGLGLSAHEQGFNYVGFTGKNIIGTFAGTANPDNVVVADAHYDSVENAPGADDNGSGTVGVMEIARILSKYPTKKTVRYIGFDLEEAGLVGSLRYVATGIPPNEVFDGVFNFEMIGAYSEQAGSQTLPTGFNILFPDAYNAVSANDFKGDFLTNVGNAASQSLVDLFKNTASQYVPQLKVISLAVPGNGQIAPDLRRSDHTPFWETNRKALMLTDGANFRNECYHTPQDTLEKLNFTFMSNVVKATLASMAVLAEVQHGDWATTSFANTVGTFDAPVCDWTVQMSSLDSDHLIINRKNCLAKNVFLEIMDEKGASVFNQHLFLEDNADETIVLGQQLPIGAYFVKLSNKEEAATKVLIVQK